MTKMHLTARPPNEGARLLARAILEVHAGDLAEAARSLTVRSDTLQRLVGGEIVPGEVLTIPLAVRAAVPPRAWRRPARGGWFDLMHNSDSGAASPLGRIAQAGAGAPLSPAPAVAERRA